MAKGAIWSFTGTTAAKLFVFVSGVACAHILTKQQFGELGIVRSTISMFVVLGASGLGATASKYISEFRATERERIPSIYALTSMFSLIAGALLSLSTLILAETICIKLLNAPNLINSVKYGAVLIFFSVLNGSQNGTLAGFEDFKSIAVNTFICSLFESSLMVLGAYYYGVEGAILGYGSGYLSLYVCNMIAINKCFNRHGLPYSLLKFSKRDLSIIFSFSLPAILSAIVVSPTFWAIRTMLVSKGGFEELAIYEAADQCKLMILFIPTTLSNIILPILSNTAVDGNRKFWKILKANMFLNGGISFLIAIVISVFSTIIMRVYGKAYTGGEIVLVIIALSTIFTSTSNVVGIAIASKAKMWYGLMFNTIWAILTILFCRLFLYFNLGAVGVAYSLLASYFCHFIYQIIYLKKLVRDND